MARVHHGLWPGRLDPRIGDGGEAEALARTPLPKLNTGRLAIAGSVCSQYWLYRIGGGRGQ